MFALRQCFIVVCLTMLVSCGFHLRGALTVSPRLKQLYLASESPYGELERNLKQNLRASGITVTESPEEANVVLTILREDQGQQLVSVAGTQQTRQYNLNLNVQFDLKENGVVILPPQVVAATRSVTIQTNQILGGSNEANTLFVQMRREVAYNILLRLASSSVTELLATAVKKPEREVVVKKTHAS